MGALGQLLEQQIVVTTAALPQQLLEALLREAGAKAVVCRCDGFREDGVDAAATADFFTAFYAALYRGACITEVHQPCPLRSGVCIDGCCGRPRRRVAATWHCTQQESSCDAMQALDRAGAPVASLVGAFRCMHLLGDTVVASS